MSLRAAILGTGRIAGIEATPYADTPPHSHAEGLTRNGFDLVAVHDADALKMNAFAGLWSIPVRYSSIDDLMAAETPDLVVIASPDDRHVDHAIAVLGVDKPPGLLVIEKPPAHDDAALGRLVQAAKAQPDCTLVVNLSRRFDAGHLALAQRIASGEFGPIVSARFDYYGGWRHNGIHAVDTSRLLLGEIEIVSAKEGTPGQFGDPCLDVVATLTDHGGASLHFEGFDEQYFQLFELELRFSNARVRLEDFGGRIMIEAVETNAFGERELSAPVPLALEGIRSPMDKLYAACRRYLAEGAVDSLNSVSLDEAAVSMRLIFDAQR